MSSYIGKGTPSLIEIGRKVIQRGFADMVLQVILHGKCLVQRTREVVTESSRTCHPSDFGANGLRPTDSSDIWTRARKFWSELRCRLAIVGLTRCTNPFIRSCYFTVNSQEEGLFQILPVSPEDSSTEIPRSPSCPIMLQTLCAYLIGTVCASIKC